MPVEGKDMEAMSELRELDAQVARQVMGWHQHTDYDYRPPQIDWFKDHDFQAHVNCDGQLEALPVWSPSRHIADAFQIIEKLRAEGWMVNMTAEDESPAWYVEFDIRINDQIRLAKGQSDSLPEAVCRAALECVKEKAKAARG